MWLLHAAWLIAAAAAGLAVVIPFIWGIGGIVRWVLLGLFVYGLASLPWVLGLILRTRWNAPEAERRNRRLLHEPADG